MTAPTVAALLDVAHELVARRCFDIETVSKLLANLPLDVFDVETRGAIRHAQLAAAAAVSGGTGRTVNARFALARVVTLLEAQVETDPML